MIAVAMGGFQEFAVMSSAWRRFGMRIARAFAWACALALGAAAPPPATAATWTWVASENGSFTVEGIRLVRYGVEPRWIERTVSGTAPCTNAFFGSDPAVGVGKACYVGSDPPALPASAWSFLAWENQWFGVSGTQLVRYGAEPHWIEKTVSASAPCTSAFFGGDPAFGIGKQCERASGPAPAGTWTFAAWENQSFTVNGSQRVRYGADTRWIEKTVSATVPCTNAFFGADPAFGVGKQCELATGGSVTLAPVATIAGPAAGATYRAGQSIAFSGSASDAEDGAVPASRLTWWVDFHHDAHFHPFHPATAGGSGTVTVPVRGETSDNVFLRFHLRATDSQGATHEATRDVLPQKARIALATQPAGLQLTLDGQPVTAPTAFTGVVGLERDLGAADQAFDGRLYRFAGWSDGGAAQHTIATPAAGTTYTATFADAGPATNQPPAVALTAPATAVRGGTVAIAATASDADGTIASVAFFDGAALIASDDTSPYGVSWTPTATGMHTLTARATDDRGATMTSNPRSVTVSEPTSDVRAPAIALTAPAHLATNLIGTLAIAASASDDVGVQSVEFQVDGVSVGAPDTAAPYGATFDTATLASGQHVVRARARDAAGNVSAWASALVAFGGSRNVPQGFARVDGWVVDIHNTTAFAATPDGRLLVAEQGGSLRVVKNGALLATPFVTLPVDATGERGLLGVAVDPNFAANGFVYLYYTTQQNGVHNRISRFTASGDVAAGPETVLVDLPPLAGGATHNGGAIHFGLDGKLYAAVGDNAISAQAQDPNVPFGKLLRFNADGTIPADNPFASTRTGLARAVFSSGLRNPFTFAVQPGTGRIHVNDVGQETWEEINLAAPGANHGWPASEGPDHASAGITAPLFAYRHFATVPPGAGPGGFLVGFCIAGGAFYPGSGPFPAPYRGSYFFADFVDGFIARLDLANGNAAYTFATGFDFPVDLLVGPDGALYVLMRHGIARISAS